MYQAPPRPLTPGPLTRTEASDLNRWLEEVARQDRTAVSGDLLLSDTGGGFHFALADGLEGGATL